jgi:hypothetical protein
MNSAVYTLWVSVLVHSKSKRLLLAKMRHQKASFETFYQSQI